MESISTPFATNLISHLQFLPTKKKKTSTEFNKQSTKNRCEWLHLHCDYFNSVSYHQKQKQKQAPPPKDYPDS